MKKILTVSALLALSTSALAGFNNTGANAAISTVAQAKTLADDSYVTLEGTIVSQVNSDEYIFRDATGDIKVEIDEKDWNGVNVGPNDKIRIHGEVDKELMRDAEIDVKRVERLQ